MIILKGHEKDLGDGFRIQRILPSLEKRAIGPFVFLDHFGHSPLVRGDEMVVRAHPHIGLATITYLYSGSILHRDSLGTEQIIRPYETNWMTAGKGIVHSERSLKTEGTDQLEGIQAWIALPREAEEVDPSFQHITLSETPILEKGGITLRLLGGNFSMVWSDANVFSSLFYADIEAKKASVATWALPNFQEAGLYVSKGLLRIQGNLIHPGQLAVFALGQPLQFEALEDSRMMMLGGEPFPEKRILDWNFVSTRPERIEEAKKAWRENTFPPVPNETDRIPLPEH